MACNKSVVRRRAGADGLWRRPHAVRARGRPPRRGQRVVRARRTGASAGPQPKGAGGLWGSSAIIPRLGN